MAAPADEATVAGGAAPGSAPAGPAADPASSAPPPPEDGHAADGNVGGEIPPPPPPMEAVGGPNDQVAAALGKLANHIGQPKKFAKASQLLRELMSQVRLASCQRGGTAVVGERVGHCLQPGGGWRAAGAVACRWCLPAGLMESGKLHLAGGVPPSWCRGSVGCVASLTATPCVCCVPCP